MSFLWIFAVICTSQIKFSQGVGKSDEAAAYTEAMSRYTEEFLDVRPMMDSSKNFTVSVGLALIDITEFNPQTGTLRLFTYERFTWKDEHLTWRPQSYGGITTLRIPSQKIWRPDITLYNSQQVVEDRMRDVLAVAYSDGQVLWIPRASYPVRCFVSGDVYDCFLKFGSWVYDGNMIDLDFYEGVEKVDTADFTASGQWEIEENTAERKVAYYDCCEEPYPSIKFHLKLRYKGAANAAMTTRQNSFVLTAALFAVILASFLRFH